MNPSPPPPTQMTNSTGAAAAAGVPSTNSNIASTGENQNNGTNNNVLVKVEPQETPEKVQQLGQQQQPPPVAMKTEDSVPPVPQQQQPMANHNNIGSMLSTGEIYTADLNDGDGEGDNDGDGDGEGGPSKRHAKKGQWQTPPVPFFPSASSSSAASNNNANANANAATATTNTTATGNASASTAVNNNMDTTSSAPALPNSSDDYAKALQEAYRRGAEAAAALSQRELNGVGSMNISVPPFAYSPFTNTASDRNTASTTASTAPVVKMETTNSINNIQPQTQQHTTQTQITSNVANPLTLPPQQQPPTHPGAPNTTTQYTMAAAPITNNTPGMNIGMTSNTPTPTTVTATTTPQLPQQQQHIQQVQPQAQQVQQPQMTTTATAPTIQSGPATTTMGVPTPLPFSSTNTNTTTTATTTTNTTATSQGTNVIPLQAQSTMVHTNTPTPNQTQQQPSNVGSSSIFEPSTTTNATTSTIPSTVASATTTTTTATTAVPPTSSSDAASRCVSLPDISSYAARANDEEAKRLKRLARNRASARLRRLRKKNLVESYEGEVGVLETALTKLRAHRWGVGTDAEALLEALSMDRGQQPIDAEKRKELISGILSQQQEQTRNIMECQLENMVLGMTARQGEGQGTTTGGASDMQQDDAAVDSLTTELNNILQLSGEQKAQLQQATEGIEAERQAIETIDNCLTAVMTNSWLLNNGIEECTDQFTSILNGTQMSKFLLWADQNSEAIDQLDYVNAPSAAAQPSPNPVFVFGMDDGPPGDE